MQPKILSKNNRIWVIGPPCSGKSTLCKLIAAILNVQAVELDELVWKSNWQRTSESEFVAKVKSILERDTWLIDGSYPEVKDIIQQQANIIIWLDIPFFLLFVRLIKRTCSFLIMKKELWNGNKENLRRIFSRNSMFLFIFEIYEKMKIENKNLFAKCNAHPLVKFIHIRSKKNYHQLIRQISVSKISEDK